MSRVDEDIKPVSRRTKVNVTMLSAGFVMIAVLLLLGFIMMQQGDRPRPVYTLLMTAGFLAEVALAICFFYRVLVTGIWAQIEAERLIRRYVLEKPGKLDQRHFYESDLFYRVAVPVGEVFWFLLILWAGDRYLEPLSIPGMISFSVAAAYPLALIALGLSRRSRRNKRKKLASPLCKMLLKSMNFCAADNSASGDEDVSRNRRGRNHVQWWIGAVVNVAMTMALVSAWLMNGNIIITMLHPMGVFDVQGYQNDISAWNPDVIDYPSGHSPIRTKSEALRCAVPILRDNQDIVVFYYMVDYDAEGHAWMITACNFNPFMFGGTGSIIMDADTGEVICVIRWK